MCSQLSPSRPAIRQEQHQRHPRSRCYAYELIRLVERGRLYVQPIARYPRQRAIVEHDDRIGMVRQSFKREEGVVRLYDDVTLLCVGKDRICLNELLRELVVQPLEHKRAKTRARSAGDGVHEHKPLETKERVVRNRHEERIGCMRTSSESLPSASLSIISITSSYNFSPDAYPCAQLFPAPPPSFDMNIFSGLYRFAHGEVNMLLITFVDVSVDQKKGAGREHRTYPRLEIDENSTRDIMLVVCLVEKHVLAIATFRRPFFEDALFVDPVFGTESLPVHGTHLIVFSIVIIIIPFN